MIWRGIIGGKKCEPVVWEKDNWGTVTADSYLNHFVRPVLRPF